jgi:glutaredoxin 3
VFTWSFSPFSKKARALLNSLGARYTAVELDKTAGGMALKKELSKRTGRSSVPSVFIRGEHVGGCFDGPGLVPLYQSGELQKMLKRARAL